MNASLLRAEVPTDGHYDPFRAAADPRRDPRYPLAFPLTVAGAIVGFLVLALTLDFVACAAIFTLFLVVGVTWHRDFLPAVPFCLGYQWLGSSSGYFFLLV